MKKLLLGALIVTASISYAKEVAAVPILVEETVVEEKNEIVDMEAIITPTTEYISVKTTKIPKKNNLYLRAGVNVWSEYDSYSISGNNQENKKVTKGKKDTLGFELGLEATRNVNENFELGLGLSYQNNSKLKAHSDSIGQKYEMGNYNSLPLYVVGKYDITTFDNGITPYIKANLGYSFNFNEKDVKVTTETGETFNRNLKVDNGLYYGIGTGMEYKNFLVDLMYQQTMADARIDNQGEKTNKKDFNHSRVTLSLGYKFNY